MFLAVLVYFLTSSINSGAFRRSSAAPADDSITFKAC